MKSHGKTFLFPLESGVGNFAAKNIKAVERPEYPAWPVVAKNKRKVVAGGGRKVFLRYKFVTNDQK